MAEIYINHGGLEESEFPFYHTTFYISHFSLFALLNWSLFILLQPFFSCSCHAEIAEPAEQTPARYNEEDYVAEIYIFHGVVEELEFPSNISILIFFPILLALSD